MEKRKSLILILIIFVLILGNFAQAGSIAFYDAAYIGNGTLSVSDPAGSPITILRNSTQVLEINNETAYMLDYQSGGLFALHQEVIFGWDETGNFTAPQLNGLNFYLTFFSNTQNLIMFIYLIILCLVVFAI